MGGGGNSEARACFGGGLPSPQTPREGSSPAWAETLFAARGNGLEPAPKGAPSTSPSQNHPFHAAATAAAQRFDVAEVMGQRRASAILDRLSFCDKYMDSLTDARKRLPIRPEDEWSGPSGSIPQ